MVTNFMVHTTQCPVCDSRQVEINVDVCPRCKTDLTLWNTVLHLPERYAALGKRMLEENRFEEARRYLGGALALDPERAHALVLLGKALAGLGRYQEAIAAWRRSLSLGMDDPSAVEDLIAGAEHYQAEHSAKQEEEAKLAQASYAERLRQQRTHWLGYSAALVTAALAIGYMLPVRHPFQSASVPAPTTTAATPDHRPAVERALRDQGIQGIQVSQKGTAVFLSGSVMVIHEKHTLEAVAARISGPSAVDLTGVQVRYPRGYFYIVRPGDSLWTIARKLGRDAQGFQKLVEANRAKAAQPFRLMPGDEILIPE